jgi:hypothetical protein
VGVFRLRPTWDGLKKHGLSLTHNEFIVARRVLRFGFKEYAIGSPLPAHVSHHRLRQFYRQRLIEPAKPLLARPGVGKPAATFQASIAPTAPATAAVPATPQVIAPISADVPAPEVKRIRDVADRVNPSKPAAKPVTSKPAEYVPRRKRG